MPAIVTRARVQRSVSMPCPGVSAKSAAMRGAMSAPGRSRCTNTSRSSTSAATAHAVCVCGGGGGWAAVCKEVEGLDERERYSGRER